jgi:hypothetical protein
MELGGTGVPKIKDVLADGKKIICDGVEMRWTADYKDHLLIQVPAKFVRVMYDIAVPKDEIDGGDSD